ncbi:pentapeptide repeat-containing protein [Nonomuraea sp. NPDC050451]|uniref:pentapeptide repeat-containing protein n=1 Tax=Nonomuraea sp. NPDC050451 TaxID=3364364 RepID=UPI003793AAE5
MTFLMIVLGVVVAGSVVAIGALLGPVTRHMTSDVKALPPDQRAEAVNATRTMLMQVGSLVAAPLSLAGLIGTFYFSSQTVSLETEKQLQARYDQALKDLRSSDSSARVQGLYELEDVAHDAPSSFAWKVTVSIAAYLQDRARGQATPRPHLTVEAALTVLGRRDRKSDRGPLSTGPVAADGVALRSTDLSGMDLRGINFTDATLPQAHFTNANLRTADFKNAALSQAHFTNADLRTADFTGADLREADFTGAQLTGTTFRNAQLEGALGLPSPKD